MGAAVKQYLDDDGEPVGKDSGVTPPAGYSLISSKKPTTSKKTVTELKAQAAQRRPISPPSGYVLQAAPPASTLEQLRNSVANSAIGYSLESTLPKLADMLNLHPSETVNSPTYASDKEQLVAPQYATDAIAKSSGLGQTPVGKERLEGGLTALGGLTSAPNMAIMAGTAVAAGLTAGLINPASAQLLSRLVSGGFSLDMLYGLYQQHKEYKQAIDSGNLTEANKIQGEMGVNGIMALLAGHHALTSHPFTPVTETPDRARTNVLHRNTAGEVRQAKGQAPTVWLSPDAWKSFMGTLYPGEDAAATHGINLNAGNDLHSFATDPQLAGANPTFGEVQQLLAKAHENAGDGGVAIAKNRPSLQANINVMREELNHTWQRSLADNGNVSAHLNPQAFTDLYHAIPSGMYDHLVDNGYSGHNSPEMVTEAAAKLMDGRPERFGVDQDDAVDFLDKYFSEVTKQHGAKALEELQHVRGIAADAKARAIEEHGRTGAGQDSGTVSGVGNSGQGGAAEGVSAGGQEGLDPAFNREKDKPIWYLKSERLIGEKMHGPMPAEDAHNMLLAGGVKPEEMHWTGLDEFLKSKGKEKVTPEEIREHLANNNLQIKEIQKGARSFDEAIADAKGDPDVIALLGRAKLLSDRAGRGTDTYNSTSNLLNSARQPSQYDPLPEGDDRRFMPFEAVDRANKLLELSSEPKFGKYVLPGGENYREMLLTLPPRRGMPLTDAERNELAALSKRVGAGTLTPTQPRFAELYKRSQERPVEPSEVQFKSSHWDEPNVLAHVRFNDRTGPNVEKLLHVEELQSDAHQQARTKGYRSSDTTELNAAKQEHENRITALAEADKAYSEAREESNKATGSALASALEAEEKAKQQVLNAMREERGAADEYEFLINRNKNAIPDLPWKKTWHEQALRRIVKHAVENGYSGVSWTGGADQAERYSLSSQVDKIAVPTVNEDGSRSVRIDPIGGGNSFKMMVSPDGTVDGSYNASQFTGKKLDEVIGKEMAKRVMDIPHVDTSAFKKGDRVTVTRHGKQVEAIVHPDRRLDEGTPSESIMVRSTDGKDNGWFVPLHDFSSQTFSGEGLKVGGEGMRGFYDKIVPDYLNKFGKKYGAKVGETKIGSGKHTVRENLMRGYTRYDVFDPSGEAVSRAWETKEAAQKEADRRNTEDRSVQYLPITPEMRKSVAEEGVPLFNREQVKTPEFQNWFNGSKVVDEKGEPLIVYHGTNKNFDTFDVDQSGKGLGSAEEKAIFFTTHPDEASAHAQVVQENTGSGANVVPVYLRVENPYISPRTYYNSKEMAVEIAKAKEDGHDGIIYPAMTYRGERGTIAVFDPKQVKSAIGNSGAFDPNDPNILRNREKSPDASGQSVLEPTTATQGGAGTQTQSIVGGSPGASPTTVIPVQGGTVLAAAPKQSHVAQTHTRIPQQTVTTVSVPLEIAIPNTPVAHRKIRSLAEIKAEAAGRQRQPKSVREVMREAKERMGNQIVP